MASVEEFKLDQWARQYGPNAKVSLLGSYPTALTLKELQDLSADTSEHPLDLSFRLNYGPSQGSIPLRKRVAALHSTPEVPLTEKNVIITPGSIAANYLILAALFGPGAHVICQFPTYGQLYQVPRFAGAEVDLWLMKEEDHWKPSMEDLRSKIKANTKAVILNTPNNPTGFVLPQSMLKEIVTMAKEHNLIVFSDEVFSPMFHVPESPPPLVSLGYRHSVSTGSLSKAYSLPGIRIGWIVSADLEIVRKVMDLRDYTTLNISQLDEAVAEYALRPSVMPALIKRNLSIGASGISLVDDFVQRNSDRCRWLRPTGGGTAWVHLSNSQGESIDDKQFAADLADKHSVAVLPGSYCFGEDGVADFNGFIRLNIGQQTPIIQEALAKVEEELRLL